MPKEDVTINHYAALEISVVATPDEIRKQFRKLALKYHPDRNPGREAEFNAKFQQIQAAHELLTDPVRRKLYDRSRLYHNGLNKAKAEKAPEATAAAYREPSSRKFNASGPTRPNFPTSARSGADQFSAKAHWEHTNRPYNQNGQSAWKTTHDKWQPRQTPREAPRTPKKTRENPYVSPEADTLPPRKPAFKAYRDDTQEGGTPSKHSFFGDRNPREREWMDSTPELRPAGNTNRNGSSGIWETKSSSEEEISRASTFYAYTPHTRLRTDLRDTSPDKPTAHGTRQANGAGNTEGNSASLSDTPISPLRSGTFTRSQTRETRDNNEHPISAQTNDRRKNGISAGPDGPERRKFSYLFNEDGTRRPHRAARQTGGSDQDGEDDSLHKARSTPIRQTYPPRRNTLDADTVPPKTPSDLKNNSGIKNAERTRFSSYSYGKPEDFQTPPGASRTFQTNEFLPASVPASCSNEQPRPKSFSVADWNNMLNSDENIFAVPARKGQQSPRKGPIVPKLQTAFNPGSPQLNFSRPRPNSTSAEHYNVPSEVALDDQGLGTSSVEPQEATSTPDTFPKNAFVFEDWRRAFSESNPFDVNLSQQNPPGATTRSTSRHRKGTNGKKGIGSFAQTKAPHTDGISIPETCMSESVADSNRPFTSHMPEPVPRPASQDRNTQTNNIPSPLAMDIDTPGESPKHIPIFSSASANRDPATSRRSGVYQSPSVSDENPVSPIKGDGPPISPLRADELPSRENNIEGQSPISSTCRSPPVDLDPEENIPVHTSPINLDSFRNVEPMAYVRTDGLNGSWQGVQDALPFDSKPARVLNLSPSPTPSKASIRIPRPPEPPTIPMEFSAVSYDKNCAAMTVYQIHWNEYNGKIVNHIKARLCSDVLRCAQNKGFATGTSSDPKTGALIDLTQTRKALAELEEDQQIREQWELAMKSHADVLVQWKSYLEHLHTASDP